MSEILQNSDSYIFVLSLSSCIVFLLIYSFLCIFYYRNTDYYRLSQNKSIIASWDYLFPTVILIVSFNYVTFWGNKWVSVRNCKSSANFYAIFIHFDVTGNSSFLRWSNWRHFNSDGRVFNGGETLLRGDFLTAFENRRGRFLRER